MSLPAMSFGDRFCFSRRGGIEGGGWVYPKGANGMVVSGFISRNNLAGTGRAISVPFGLNGVRNFLILLAFPLMEAQGYSTLNTVMQSSYLTE